MRLSPDYIVDFDSTLIAAESLDVFGELALKNAPGHEATCAELQAITDLGMNGSMPFDASLAARLALFSAHRDHISQLNDQLSAQLSPSAVEHQEWFRENAESIYVVSGGFEEFIKPTVARLGILAANVYANRFIFDEGDNIVGHDTKRLTAKPGGKAAQVHELGLEGPVIAIGDAYTDLEIRLEGAADEFWAFTETIERPSVLEAADRIVTGFGELASVSNT